MSSIGRELLLSKPNTLRVLEENLPYKCFIKRQVIGEIANIELRAYSILGDDCPYIVRALGYMIDGEYINLYLEHCGSVNLLDYLISGGFAQEYQAAKCFVQLMRGLAFIHEKKLLHRDIKAENIMIIFHDACNFTMKIIDMGFASMQHPFPSMKRCGSYHYIAPEVISNSNGYNGVAADVYSLGVVLYVIVHRKFPYDGEDATDVLNMLMFTPRIPGISEVPSWKRRAGYSIYDICPFDLMDLMNGLMERKWKLRMTLPDAFRHRWFRRLGFRLQKH